MTDADKAWRQGWTDPLSQAQANGHPTTHRSLFFVCFIVGLLAMLAALAGSVVYNAQRLDLFADGLNQYVVASGVVNQNDADKLAAETIGYLTGDQGEWTPKIMVNGEPLVIPDAFSQHMAEVRGGVRFVRSAVVAAAAAALVMLLLCALSGQRSALNRRFSAGGYYLGTLLPLLAVSGLGLWAVFDFNTFWAWLHYTLIPGGIFNAREPVMMLFPEALFAGYIQPVGESLVICVAALLAWPAVALAIVRAHKVKQVGSVNG